MTEDLRGKVCVVTGATGVLGGALAVALAEAGVKVAVVGRRDPERVAESIATRHGVEAIGVRADVVDRSSLEEAAARIGTELGAVDLLVNCAGGNAPAGTTPAERIEPDLRDDLATTFFGLDPAAFAQVFDLNVLGTVLPTMVFARGMVERGSGSIVNVSSMAASRPLTKVVAYSAAKASVENLTRWLAVHLARTGVRVNAVAPGFILTNQNRFLLVDEATGEPTARGGKIVAATPMGRFGQPDEIAGATLYLLSDASRFVTGIVLPVDGGFGAYAGV